MTKYIAALLLSYAAAGGVSAQDALTQDTAGLREALSRAEARNWTVRARLHDQSVLEGRIHVVRRDGYEIGIKPLPLERVRRMEMLMREGGGGKRGFLLGAVAGSALVFSLAAALSEGNAIRPGAVILSALFGTVLGGSPGALVGSSIDPPVIHWVPFWP